MVKNEIATPEEFSPEERSVVARLLDRAKEKKKPIIAMKLTKNQLRGAIRRAKRQKKRAAFKGSEGFERSAIATYKSSGLSDKALARQRAREFNQGVGGNHGTGSSETGAA